MIQVAERATIQRDVEHETAASPLGSSADAARFHNRAAMYLWGISGLFLLFATTVTYLLMFSQAGSPTSQDATVTTLLVCLWMGSIAFVRQATRYPVIEIEIETDGAARIEWVLPFKRRVRLVSASEIAGIDVVDSYDSNGHPYYYARIRLRDNSAIDFAEGHDRSRCRDQSDRLRRLLKSRNKPSEHLQAVR